MILLLADPRMNLSKVGAEFEASLDFRHQRLFAAEALLPVLVEVLLVDWAEVEAIQPLLQTEDRRLRSICRCRPN